ncbi:hypothetical protein HCZ23_09070 [Celeribacter sp. HF31]|uniref:hypothetical protein n=1 Tax=Celeribacter sp. HF31 TaxID=2721558 RepID=UPI00143206B9|nr:hypothetical protein [Celeribacter sp. HF31]NIY79621.1 hypothetical protein [Celeribacter sp. HF31]
MTVIRGVFAFVLIMLILGAGLFLFFIFSIQAGSDVVMTTFETEAKLDNRERNALSAMLEAEYAAVCGKTDEAEECSLWRIGGDSGNGIRILVRDHAHKSALVVNSAPKYFSLSGKVSTLHKNVEADILEMLGNQAIRAERSVRRFGVEREANLR